MTQEYQTTETPSILHPDMPEGGRAYETHKKILGFAPSTLPTGATVLEMGPGTGLKFAIGLKGERPDVSVISVSPDLKSKEITGKIDPRGKKISHVIAAEGGHLPLRDNTIDSVVVFHVYEHINPEEFVKMVREIVRVMAAGGKALIGPVPPHHESMSTMTLSSFPGPFELMQEYDPNLLDDLKKAGCRFESYSCEFDRIQVIGASGKPFPKQKIRGEVLSIEKRPHVLVDKELGERYEKIARIGRDILEGSPILMRESDRALGGHDLAQAIADRDSRLREDDVTLVKRFLDDPDVSPALSRWRQSKREIPFGIGDLVDESTYGNWSSPGGPREHIFLAMDAASILAEVFDINRHKMAIVAGLHDVGRLHTHTFYVNDLIGAALLRRMGVWQDLIETMPDEQVMLTPTPDREAVKTALAKAKNTSVDDVSSHELQATIEDQADDDMETVIDNLTPEQVIMRIADEFGKRAPGTNRLYSPADYNAWDRSKWLAGYQSKAPSGRPSDAWWRTQQKLHVDNVPRYFKALDTWVRKHSSDKLNLESISQMLNDRLAPQLIQLNAGK